MSEYGIAKRFKKLISHESRLCQKDALFVKNLAKYHDQRSKLQAKIVQQLEELKSCQKEVTKLRKFNKKLSKFLEEEQLRLQRDTNQLDELHQETTVKKHLLIQEKQRESEEMDNLRCFKSCTQIFINSQRLPEFIQGAAVCEKENTSQLIPFKIDPQQHRHEVVMDMLWRLADQPESLNGHWHDLIIGFFDANIPIQIISDTE